MTRYARRIDANHAEIRTGLREAGFEVLDLSGAGNGVPDILVRLDGSNGLAAVPLFLEIKDGDKPLSAQALTPAQEKWHYFAWPVTAKVRSLEEALEALQHAKGRA